MAGASAEASASSLMYSRSLRFSLAARRPVNATTALLAPNFCTAPDTPGAGRDPLDLLLGQADAEADHHMLGPLVLGLAVPSRPQDQQLAVARRKLAVQDFRPERHPSPDPGLRP